MSDIVLWVHVLAAGAWVGTNVVQAVAPPLMQRGGIAAEVAWFRAMSDFENRIYTPAGVVILLTGVELVRSTGRSYGDPFVLIGIAAVTVGVGLGVAVFGPAGRSAGEALESGDREAAAATLARLRAFGIVDTVVVVFAVFAMVSKLGT